jgi:Leucine-rich repeat (LRR) protein
MTKDKKINMESKMTDDDLILNSQALALMNRGEQVCALNSHYFTPNEAAIPNRKKTSSVHVPIALRNNDNKPIQEKDKVNSLDGFTLLEASGMGFPDEVTNVTVSDKGYQTVVEDDLNFFTELIYLDVSENVLDFEPFSFLPKIEELRLACNNITHINNVHGFNTLLRLDLAYNKLSLQSVQVISCLTDLRELDLCGNSLRNVPYDLCKLVNLEKLLLDNNNIDDNNIFKIVCTVPKLRVISLAYNFLSKIPEECCQDVNFRFIDTMDISFNYFAQEVNLQPLLELPRLLKLMLYGNPLLGISGEDVLQTHIEDLMELSADIHAKKDIVDIEFITEVPRVRNFKKGLPAGRNASYRNFEIVNIGTKNVEKPTRSFREEGNRTLFAETFANKKATNVVDYTFLTGINDNEAADESINVMTEEIMNQVAHSLGMGTASSAELLLLKDKTTLPITVTGAMNLNEAEEEDSNYETSDKVPHTLFSNNYEQQLDTYPVGVQTAMRALRFAVRNPLSDHNDVPSKGFIPKTGFAKSTQAYQNRKLPRRSDARELLEQQTRKSSLEHLKDMKNKPARGLPEPELFRDSRSASRKEALIQIDQVLNNLNSNVDEFAQKPYGHSHNIQENIRAMKNFARPNTGLNSLLSMVNEVVADFDE